MDKITFLCLSQYIKKFESKDTNILFENVQSFSKWFASSVSSIGSLSSFDTVQKELLNLAQLIVEGKKITPMACAKLLDELKVMQQQILQELKIIVFVSNNVNPIFNKNVKVVRIENESECVELAYSLHEELKYLVTLRNEKSSLELVNAVDIVLDIESFFEVSTECYPIDKFDYDRLFLTAKLNKINSEQSKILITGSYHAMVGIKEVKMPYLATNMATGTQDLYYSLLSVKEAIKRSKDLDTIIISLPYYFFFSDMLINPTKDMLTALSKVNYPIYNLLRGYKGKVLPIYNKQRLYPIYEAVCDLGKVRDMYHEALIKDFENLDYYNEVNCAPTYGMLNYNFLEKNDNENYDEARKIANNHNGYFDLDKGINNRNLLDKFLDNMEELDKNVILFVPPVTKFYRNNISYNMKGTYERMVSDVVNRHSCCKLVDFFDPNDFDENDFRDYDELNENGAEKLSQKIAEFITI